MEAVPNKRTMETSRCAESLRQAGPDSAAAGHLQRPGWQKNGEQKTQSPEVQNGKLNLLKIPLQ